MELGALEEEQVMSEEPRTLTWQFFLSGNFSTITQSLGLLLACCQLLADQLSVVYTADRNAKKKKEQLSSFFFTCSERAWRTEGSPHSLWAALCVVRTRANAVRDNSFTRHTPWSKTKQPVWNTVLTQVFPGVLETASQQSKVQNNTTCTNLCV